MDYRKRFRYIAIGGAVLASVLALSLPLWSEVTVYKAAIVALLICALSTYLFYLNVSRYVVEGELKELAKAGINSEDLKMAQVLAHYGRYEQALVKLRFVLLEHPNNSKLQKVVNHIEMLGNG